MNAGRCEPVQVCWQAHKQPASFVSKYVYWIMRVVDDKKFSLLWKTKACQMILRLVLRCEPSDGPANGTETGSKALLSEVTRVGDNHPRRYNPEDYIRAHEITPRPTLVRKTHMFGRCTRSVAFPGDRGVTNLNHNRDY